MRKNNVEEIKELPKQENINPTVISKEKEVSNRGKVLCFERARQEKNEFLSEIAYDTCLLTIDENLKEYDKKQSDLYFIEKKEEKKITKPISEVKPKKKKKKKKITKPISEVKPKKKKKNKNKNNKIVNTEKKENSCKEGSIAGGVIGAGIGAVTAKGKNKMWAVPTGGVAGALIGCQLDGG